MDRIFCGMYSKDTEQLTFGWLIWNDTNKTVDFDITHGPVTMDDTETVRVAYYDKTHGTVYVLTGMYNSFIIPINHPEKTVSAKLKNLIGYEGTIYWSEPAAPPIEYQDNFKYHKYPYTFSKNMEQVYILMYNNGLDVNWYRILQVNLHSGEEAIVADDQYRYNTPLPNTPYHNTFDIPTYPNYPQDITGPLDGVYPNYYTLPEGWDSPELPRGTRTTSYQYSKYINNKLYRFFKQVGSTSHFYEEILYVNGFEKENVLAANIEMYNPTTREQAWSDLKNYSFSGFSINTEDVGLNQNCATEMNEPGFLISIDNKVYILAHKLIRHSLEVDDREYTHGLLNVDTGQFHPVCCSGFGGSVQAFIPNDSSYLLLRILHTKLYLFYKEQFIELDYPLATSIAPYGSHGLMLPIETGSSAPYLLLFTPEETRKYAIHYPSLPNGPSLAYSCVVNDENNLYINVDETTNPPYYTFRKLVLEPLNSTDNPAEFGQPTLDGFDGKATGIIYTSTIQPTGGWRPFFSVPHSVTAKFPVLIEESALDNCHLPKQSFSILGNNRTKQKH